MRNLETRIKGIELRIENIRKFIIENNLNAEEASDMNNVIEQELINLEILKSK